MTALDVLPTVAALAGAAGGPSVDGEDVSELLRGGARGGASDRPFLYYAGDGPLAGIRRGRWKLLLESGELYDVEQDVSESRDLAAENGALVAELRQLALDLDAEISAHAMPVRVVEQRLFNPERPAPEARAAR